MAFKPFRVEREICSDVLGDAGVKAWLRVDVDSSEHLRRRVERRACPVKLALLHVTVSDIGGLDGQTLVEGEWIGLVR